MRTRNVLALVLAGCQAAPGGHASFGGASEVTVAGGSSGGGSMSSGDAGGTTTTGAGSGSGGEDTVAEPVRDLGGMPDFGDGAPIGCKGKIDFLFVVSRYADMMLLQEQLAGAFPQFIATIEAKFADFDYHIMVVDGDADWGNPICTDLCGDPTCKIGEPCCPWGEASHDGEPCCPAPDYPCEDLGLLSVCDTTWGAGVVFPAGVDDEANKPCPIDGGRRYLVKGQKDLAGTFECIARVGGSGWDSLGQALTAAVAPPMNKLGGCNPGFLRDDALLMVTLIASNPDSQQSEGTPSQWAKAVIDAKHGDDKSVVMFSIGGCNCGPHEGECSPFDRLCTLTTMFPYHHRIDVLVDPVGPGFAKAADLVETACAGFVPPG